MSYILFYKWGRVFDTHAAVVVPAEFAAVAALVLQLGIANPWLYFTIAALAVASGTRDHLIDNLIKVIHDRETDKG